jgi:glycosyltransferase involved in cell wall biosynthesis
MRVGIYYAHLHGSGGYPGDIGALVDGVEALGHDVVRYSGKSRSTRRAAAERLRSNQDAIDVLGIFGLFLPSNVGIARVARRGRVPYVCSLLSQQTPALLADGRRLIKSAYTRLYELAVLRSAAGIHFYSEYERSLWKSIQRLTSFEASLGVPPPHAELTIGPRENTDRGFTFFGRLDVHQKGLDILLEAFALSGPDLGGHRKLSIVGRDYRGGLDRLVELADRLSISDYVTFVGESEDFSPIQQARFLVYPSRYDGPPRPPRLALSIGVPLVVTDATNMGNGVVEFGAGFSSQATPESLAQSLAAAARVTDESLVEMQHNALRLAERWSWSRVAEDYARGLELVINSNGK